jgi:hypothetical protein
LHSAGPENPQKKTSDRSAVEPILSAVDQLLAMNIPSSNDRSRLG